MKKLLALILCVMMFVAVMPTSAFAGDGVYYSENGWKPGANDVVKEWAGKTAATKAVESMNKAVKNLYGAYAADKGVFDTVKAIDDTVKSLAEGMFDGIDKLTLTKSDGTALNISTNKALVDTTKEFLKEHIGGEISKYMKEHKASYTSSETITGDGTRTVIDPIKYMNTFATAASKAMSSEKAVKNIEAVVYLGALASAQKEIKDKREDLFTDYEASDVDFSKYGWRDYTSNDGHWNPLPFVSTDAYYDYGVKSNFDTTIGDWINDYSDTGITEYPAPTSSNPFGPAFDWMNQ
jgi:hypothetical protein